MITTCKNRGIQENSAKSEKTESNFGFSDENMEAVSYLLSCITIRIPMTKKDDLGYHKKKLSVFREFEVCQAMLFMKTLPGNSKIKGMRFLTAPLNMSGIQVALQNSSTLLQTSTLLLLCWSAFSSHLALVSCAQNFTMVSKPLRNCILNILIFSQNLH